MLPAPNPQGCKQAIADALDQGPVVLLLADADGLKGVNDKYGHLIGDTYLETVFNTLKEIFPAVWDRYGGDEFVGIAPAETIIPHEYESKTVEIMEETIRVGFSVGYVHLNPGCNVNLGLAMADAGMYRIKQIHHGGVAEFEPVGTVGLRGNDWPEIWYIPLIRQGIQFILDYHDEKPVELVLTSNINDQDGIWVDDAVQFKALAMGLLEDEFNSWGEKDNADEFGEWGERPEIKPNPEFELDVNPEPEPETEPESIEWRTKQPDSLWETQDDDRENVKLHLEGISQTPIDIIVEPVSEPQPREKRKWGIPQIPLPQIQMPQIQLPRFNKPEKQKQEDNTVPPRFQGKTIWIWGANSSSIALNLAKTIGLTENVLYLDGNLKSPMTGGDWADSWAAGNPAMPPQKTIQENKLMIWALGKRPPITRNLKDTWEYILYNLSVPEQCLIVGGGNSAPPPTVDMIVFVSNTKVDIAPPGVWTSPSTSPDLLVSKISDLIA